VVVLQDENGARDVLHCIPHYTQCSRKLPPRTSFYSLIHLSLLTGHARDAPIQGKLDGSLHTERDSPTTSKVIPLYHDIRGIDLAFFLFLIYLTEGSASPFFVYFVFSLVCATLRWRWHGTLWTAIAALTMFIGMGVYGAIVLHDSAFRLNRVIIRAVYLAVAAALLGYLAAHKRRVDRNMSKLADWPRGTFREVSALAQN
jgi:hypothetical protein